MKETKNVDSYVLHYSKLNEDLQKKVDKMLLIPSIVGWVNVVLGIAGILLGWTVFYLPLATILCLAICIIIYIVSIALIKAGCVFIPMKVTTINKETYEENGTVILLSEEVYNILFKEIDYNK